MRAALFVCKHAIRGFVTWEGSEGKRVIRNTISSDLTSPDEFNRDKGHDKSPSQQCFIVLKQVVKKGKQAAGTCVCACMPVYVREKKDVDLISVRLWRGQKQGRNFELQIEVRASTLWTGGQAATEASLSVA